MKKLTPKPGLPVYQYKAHLYLKGEWLSGETHLTKKELEDALKWEFNTSALTIHEHKRKSSQHTRKSRSSTGNSFIGH